MSATSAPSVPYGVRLPKSCLPCAKVKARCEIAAGVETCQRCRRLKKTCSKQAPGAHRRTAITLNRAGVEEGANDTGSRDRSPLVFIDQIVNGDNEGEKLLQSYRDDMEPQFPFVVLPPRQTFANLKQQRPLLVLAILMVGLRRDHVRQTKLASKIRDIISYDLLIKGNETFDLLQCLLIYINWYHFQLHLNSQLCNFVHLLMATSTELGLNKEASPNARTSGFGRFGYFGRAGSVLNMNAPKGLSTRTLEERRAFLGCFFLTSVTSMCIRDIEPIRYSRYIDRCRCILQEAAEFPTDFCVSHLTRLHSLAQKIDLTLSFDNYPTAENFTAAPAGACVKALEADLRQLKDSLPESFRNNALYWIHYHVVEIFLYERAIDPADQPSERGVYPFARLHMLCACLESIRHCRNAFHSIPASHLFDTSYTTLTLFSHIFVVVSKLSLLRTRDWDHSHAQKVLNFAEIADETTQQIHEARALAEYAMEGEDETSVRLTIPKLFLVLPDTLRKVKAVHETMYAAQTTSSSSIPQHQPTGLDVTFSEDDFLKLPSEFFIDDFWQYLTWPE